MKKTILLTFILFIGMLSTHAKNKKEKMEKFSYTTMVSGSYEEVYKKVEDGLKAVNFGIVTEVALHEKIKGKLGKDMPIYQILGVCNPKHAYDAIQVEENIGLFLPCKVLIKEKGENSFEVVSINAVEVMGMTGEEGLNEVATTVDKSLKAFIDAL